MYDYVSLGDNEIPDEIPENIPDNANYNDICGFKKSPYGLYESACTLNCSWGYTTASLEWKSPETIAAARTKLEKLGINYLINVGPDWLGRIPCQATEILEKAQELYSQNKDYKYDDFSDLRKKYFGDENAKDETPTAPSANNMPAGDNNPNKNSYGDILSQSGFSTQRESEGYLSSRSPDALSREHLERRLMGCETEEKPMVFASRRDPNIIIYEYSDRLKFYKKTKRGLIHVSTEFKQ